MKLKKFNEINESNNDKNDGNNLLTPNVKKCVKELLINIQNYVNDINETFKTKMENDSNSFSYTLDILTEQKFTYYIIKEIKSNLTYEYGNNIVNISIDKKIDSRSTMLLFEDGDNKFTIPLITTMSLLEDGKITYSVWLNTYVAKKI